MLEHWKNKDFQVIKEENMPTVIKDMDGVRNVEELLVEKYAKGSGAFCGEVLDLSKRLRRIVEDRQEKCNLCPFHSGSGRT